MDHAGLIRPLEPVQTSVLFELNLSFRVDLSITCWIKVFNDGGPIALLGICHEVV